MDFNDSDTRLSDLSNNYSDSESTQSTPEDERIKRLFLTCDTNGDGFITYDDIRRVCIQLQMECCVDEIMDELGPDINGRISYNNFVKRRSLLLNTNNKCNSSDTSEEYDSLSESKKPLISEEFGFESTSNQSSSVAEDPAIVTTLASGLHNENESSGHESWEYDSGAHDLEIGVMSLHKQIEASGIQMPTNVNELLDLANRYYIESINCIKQEKRQIYDKLKSILREHEFLQKQVACLKDEKTIIIKDLEKKKQKERKEYECKITELQSIIGELSHDLNYYQFLMIREEDGDQNGDTSLNETTLDENNMQLALKKSIIDSNMDSKIGNTIKEKENLAENDLVLFGNVMNTKELSKTTVGDDRHSNALEMDRLECRITNLETQIDLSDLHLNESKASAERLTVLLAKYESNNTALELALNYTDKALEVNELLVALLKTEIGLVLANCRAAGVGQTGNTSEAEEKEEVMRIYEMANYKRKVAEEAALEYLAKYCPEIDIKPNEEFSRHHENYLKDFLQKLKDEKIIIRNSITNVEPFIVDTDKDSDYTNDLQNKCSNFRLNVEDIVALQDLVSVKELNANLRAQVYSLQTENANLAQQVVKMKTINANNKFDSTLNISDNDTKQSDNESLDKLTKANSNLRKEIEKTKKKYSIKMKKSDQKLTSMSQRYNAHVKILQNKISLLESQGSVRRCIETTI